MLYRSSLGLNGGWYIQDIGYPDLSITSRVLLLTAMLVKKKFVFVVNWSGLFYEEQSAVTKRSKRRY